MDNTAPVTVGELVDALATYPRDAIVMCQEAGTGMGDISVHVDGRWVEVWDGTTSAADWYRPETVPFARCRPKPLPG